MNYRIVKALKILNKLSAFDSEDDASLGAI